MVRNKQILKPNYLGVADGVGGWRSKGIDPSIFSGNLVKYATINSINMLDDSNQENEAAIHPEDIMALAYKDIVSKAPDSYGILLSVMIFMNKRK